MLYNYGLQLLELELEKEMKSKKWTEEYFVDHGGVSTYKAFCESHDRIEHLEKAIKILKNGLNNSNEFV